MLKWNICPFSPIYIKMAYKFYYFSRRRLRSRAVIREMTDKTAPPPLRAEEWRGRQRRNQRGWRTTTTTNTLLACRHRRCLSVCLSVSERWDGEFDKLATKTPKHFPSCHARCTARCSFLVCPCVIRWKELLNPSSFVRSKCPMSIFPVWSEGVFETERGGGEACVDWKRRRKKRRHFWKHPTPISPPDDRRWWSLQRCTLVPKG